MYKLLLQLRENIIGADAKSNNCSSIVISTELCCEKSTQVSLLVKFLIATLCRNDAKRSFVEVSIAKNLILALLLIAPLSACGFTPIYADKENYVSAKEHLGAIIVASPKSKRGQFFQYAIQDRLSPKGEKYNPRYRLHTDLKLDEQPIIIEQNGEIRRYRIMIESPFTLVGLADGKIVYRGKVKRTVSYNVADNDYSTYVASENAVDDGLTELAKDFEQRLASFFTSYEER